MKDNIRFLAIFIVAPLFFQSCGHKTKAVVPPKFSYDTSRIVVDESARPIIEEEVYIFKALNPNIHANFVYLPENSAVPQLLEDSTRIAILARDLTPDEYKLITAKSHEPDVNRIAIDAVTLIVNQASNDTTITVSDIKKMLNGNTKQDKNIVFDNPNSSVVGYLKKLSGNTLLKGKNIYALKSDKEVIKYVSEHTDAIGITGFSWLNDPDKDYADAVNKVKIVGVRDDTSKTASAEYFKPSQNTLALKQYPLTRNLYLVNSMGLYGLGRSFETFLLSDRGQRIILKSGLLPDNIPGREINIVKKIKQ
jgi:phosphate transport system substrate-binding protein